MAYKTGTYKLNLGIDIHLKNRMDILQSEYNFPSYSELIRYLINKAYENNSNKSSIDMQISSLRADFEELRGILNKVLEVK